VAGKYEPLTQWLQSLERSPIEVAFAEIERVVGFRLPASSRHPLSAAVPLAVGEVSELLRTYKNAIDALKVRGVVRSTKVLADYAEWLAAQALNLELAAGGAAKGYDATDPRTGTLYQVKARMVAPPHWQPDLRGQGSLDGRPFDFLVGVLLGGDYDVRLAAVIPLALVRERAKRIAYNNGYRFHLGSGVLEDSRVQDVTERFREAAML